ncbi:unnamed protein product [Sphenostylis stenocarpa]|uniref:Uncharacterized protein n=1 Tax=Sphenostylis stenocarpa TaxID=92480 RepID=A0AA86SJA5_9FABA|nr:unnamed protein product [Sphenostylis stenocarpa]
MWQYIKVKKKRFIEFGVYFSLSLSAILPFYYLHYYTPPTHPLSLSLSRVHSRVKLWEKGRQRQSLLQRNEWISLILSSAALSAIMAAV